MKNQLLFVSLLAAQGVLTSGFSARSVEKPFRTLSSFPHQATMTAISEEEAQYLMAKARECAYNDSCSIEESREHLHDVLNIQVACASGAVAGHDVCDDQQEVAEIVALLRQHTLNGTHGLTTRQQSAMGISFLPISFLILTCLSMVLVHANPNVQPFTFQEVVWATRDGYLDDLVVHFLKNGGLVVGDADVIPFTFQEVMWATRDGYLDDLVSHFFRNGGL